MSDYKPCDCADCRADSRSEFNRAKDAKRKWFQKRKADWTLDDMREYIAYKDLEAERSGI